MHVFFLIAGLIFTWFFASTLIYKTVCHWLQPKNDTVLPRWWTLLLPTGPITISLLLWGLFTFLPGQSHTTYLYSVLGCFGLLTVILYVITKRRHNCYVNRLRKYLMQQAKTIKPNTTTLVSSTVILATVLFVLTHAALALLHPVLGADSAQYAFVSRMGFDLSRFDFYPFYQPDALFQYVDTSDHPPTYYFLKIWHFILAGSAQSDGWSKLIEPMMVIYGSLMLGTSIMALGLGAIASCIGVVLWVSMPALGEVARFHGIDLYYMVPFMAACLWFITEVRDTSNTKTILMGGILAGIAMATHNLIGLIMLPMAGLIYTTMAWPITSPATWIKAAGLTLAGALPIGGLGFLANLLHHGQVVGAGLPLLDSVKSLQYYAGRKLSVGMGTPAQNIIYGGFKLWALNNFFGLLPWVALTSTTPLSFRLPTTPTLPNTNTTMVSVGAAAGLIAIIGLNLFSSLFAEGRFSILAMNPRYSLLAGVFLAILATIGLTSIITHWVKQSESKASAILSVIFLGVFVYGVLGLWPNAQFATHGLGLIEGNPMETWATYSDDPTFAMLKRIQTHVPKNATLVTPQKDLVIHYLNRRAFSESEPQFANFYTARSSEEALAELDKHNIDYVAQYPYAWPTHQGNSYWGVLLADPGTFELVDEQYLLRIFKRIPNGQPTRPRPIAKATTLAQAKQTNGTTCMLWNFTSDLTQQAPEIAKKAQTKPIIVAGQATGAVDIFLADLNDSDTQHHQWLWHHVVSPKQPQVFAAQFTVPDSYTQPVLGLCPSHNTADFSLKSLRLMQ